MIQQLNSVDQYCCLFHKKHQVTTECCVPRLQGLGVGCELGAGFCLVWAGRSVMGRPLSDGVRT
jgi:ABC-type antimicrobial peptide transport system ATPase subunit